MHVILIVIGLILMVFGGGWLMFRWGLRIDREKRKPGIVRAKDPAKDKQS